MTKARGRFISVEGVEGVGKTTAIDLLAEILAARGIAFVRTREPGGTPVAELLRDVVLGHHDEALTDTTELLLMFAARAQSVAGVIRPALERGEWVLCDRFTDATLAYQGYARGLPMTRIYQLAEWVHGDTWPDTTILLEASSEIIARRLRDRERAADRIEQQRNSFFARAAAGYRELAAAHPARYSCIDSGQSLDAVRDALAQIINEQLPETA